MLFVSCFAADYIVAAQKKKEVDDQDKQEIYSITKRKLERK